MAGKFTSLDDPCARRITEAVENSDLRRIDWDDRGVAPIGYLKGMTLTYARAYCGLKTGEALPLRMARARTTDLVKDAVAKYAATFQQMFSANTTVDGVDVLRSLFTLLVGVGMRESSGEHCTGWDRGKLTGWGDPARIVKPTATNAEAGIFQASYDIGVASRPDYMALYSHYKTHSEDGLLPWFKEGVKCSAKSSENFGNGAGLEFQEISKNCPAFSAELAALGMRDRANHWGPIRKKTAQIVPDCWVLLGLVEQIVDELGCCEVRV